VKRHLKWFILGITILLALVALWFINSMAKQIRASEQEKVKIWAGAVAQKSELVRHYDTFFKQVELDERRKIDLYTDILESFGDPNMSTDLKFSLSYVNYIVDSSKTPLIITDRDSIITVPADLAGKKLEGKLLKDFSENEPFHYSLWGMPMTLYYKETEIYTDLRAVLFDFTRSYLNEITNNAVSVPVLIVDSTGSKVLESGNINHAEFNTPGKLANKLKEMKRANTPIRITLYDDRPAFVYYEDTPLLRMMRFIPVIYLFIAFVLVFISYYLFRTAQSDEQNRIWVGMAKETAHQLGTPISSLMAWREYLQGKVFDEQYAVEVKKDLDRLDTIARRFSKIGSVPELTVQDVNIAVCNAINYLQPRVSKKVNFVINTSEEPMMAPLNRYLFEWVIENLCKNAVDAMDGKGQITATVSGDARYVYVDVADTGKGIAPANQKHIFDSGFTTKQRGWGLGLSLAKRIINSYHRGKIILKYSIEGQGSVFQIILQRDRNNDSHQKQLQ
jgi:signal transduction histidine kinase